VNSSNAITADTGAKRTISFTGSTQVTLNCSLAALVAASIATSSYPYIRSSLSVNGVASTTTDTQMAASMQLYSGLTTGNTYTLTYEFLRGDYTVDAWTTPVMAVNETSLSLDFGSTVSAPTNLYTNNIIVFGDSITQGLNQYGAGITYGDGTSTYAKAISQALQAEVGQVGKGGAGWTIAGAGNVPAFPSSWNYLWSGQSRTFPALQAVLVVEGTNDYLYGTPSSVAAAVYAWLTAARTQFGSNTFLFIGVPFGGFCRTQLNAGVTAYQAATPSDKRVAVLDAGLIFEQNFAANLTGSGSRACPYDGVHPNPCYQGEGGAIYAKQMQAFMDSVTGSGSGGNGNGITPFLK
jgi:hypothetical protein